MALACSGPGAGAPPRSSAQTRDLSGLTVELAVRGGPPDASAKALAAGFAEAERLAAALLAERPASEIDVLNRVPMRVEIELSPDAAAVVATALELAESSGGAYDPTARAPLRKVWGLESGKPRVPRAFEIDSALRSVDWTDLELGEAGHSARRYSHSTHVDLGAVAVGAVLDGAVAALRRAGAPAGLARARGIRVAFGGEGAPWPIELPTPLGPARLELSDGAVATAEHGPGRPTSDGQSIREPFDPRSGRPAEGCEWALARGPSGARAGGAAAALLVLGREASQWWAREPGIEGAVVLAGPDGSPAGERLASPGAGLAWDD
ncbi:MAG: FAD:protein FMN transferase [Myxococcota bacterium]